MRTMTVHSNDLIPGLYCRTDRHLGATLRRWFDERPGLEEIEVKPWLDGDSCPICGADTLRGVCTYNPDH